MAIISNLIWRRLTILVLSCSAIILSSTVAAAERRVALIIGNGKYKHTQTLANPVNDANLLASTLRDKKFEVLLHTDLDQKGMKRAVSVFTKKLQAYGNDTVGLIYYAGHGVQIGGLNYLLPIDAQVESESDVDIESVEANAVMRGLQRANNRLNIIILDACRNNPFRSLFRSASRGLARMDAPTGSLIAYSTSPGQVAADGDGSNSPYTEALAQQLNVPGIKIEEVFKRVRRKVHSKTRGKQTPWVSTSLLGDFYVQDQRAATSKPKAGQQPLDLIYWRAVQNTKDTSVLKEFIQRFPKSIFSNSAKAKLEKLLSSSGAAARSKTAVNNSAKTIDTRSDQTARRDDYKNRYNLFHANGRFFVKGTSDEVALLNEMKRGRKAYVTGTLDDGSQLELVFSLAGVAAAWDRLSRNCSSWIRRRKGARTKPSRDRNYKSWAVYYAKETCFLATKAVKVKPTRAKKLEILMYVTNWPKQDIVGEISWTSFRKIPRTSNLSVHVN